MGSILVSTGAGFVSSGASLLLKAKNVGTLGKFMVNTGVEVVESMAMKKVKGEDISLRSVATDVVQGKIANKIGDQVKLKIEPSKELVHNADRANRIVAGGSARNSRIENANNLNSQIKTINNVNEGVNSFAQKTVGNISKDGLKLLNLPSRSTPSFEIKMERDATSVNMYSPR